MAAEDVVELCALLVHLEPGVFRELVHHARQRPAEALDFPDAGQSLRAVSDFATIQGPSKYPPRSTLRRSGDPEGIHRGQESLGCCQEVR